MKQTLPIRFPKKSHPLRLLLIYLLTLLSFKTYVSGKVDCVTISSDKYKPCVFPVLWKGEYRNECIASGSKWWCATELKDDGQYQKFGHCGDSCPREGKEPLSVI